MTLRRQRFSTRSAGFAWALMALVSCLSAANAGEADVIGVKPVQSSGGTWRFDVTIRHADEGWDHYADRFEIVGPDGEIFGTRVLLHPHVEEQPFTRSLDGVAIPQGTARVVVRAHDKVHEFGGGELSVDLPTD